MTEELDVFRIIGERLETSNIPFMLTGSFALGYYGKPRMTRDTELQKRDVSTLLDDSVDWPYLRKWAPQLGVGDMLEEFSK